jgi:hypothetical protein
MFYWSVVYVARNLFLPDAFFAEYNKEKAIQRGTTGSPCIAKQISYLSFPSHRLPPLARVFLLVAMSALLLLCNLTSSEYFLLVCQR